MKILIDADGCPVVDATVQIAKERQLACIILCDTAHVLEKDGATTLVFSKGADSVDFELVNRVSPGYCYYPGLWSCRYVFGKKRYCY